MSAVNSCLKLGCLAVLLSTTSVSAQSIAERLPILVDADSSVLDRRNGEIVFTGLRITQGAIGIEAQRGVTTLTKGNSLDFSDSVWEFTGAVKIDIESAKIRSDSARLYFKKHQLQRATVSGEPARFDDRGRVAGEPLSAEAESFDYDLAGARIRFSGNARITEGDNEVAGADLDYNLRTQQVNFKGDPGNDERVRITIVPDKEDTTDNPP